MDAMGRDERGSVLIITVVAMLILGVLSVSFTLLAGVETRIGVNYKQQAQAEALAEAGLEVARDAVRTAATAPGGFTPWLGGALLANGVSLGPGQYWARIDNDCNPLVPTAIAEPPAGSCNANGPDTNEVAVITSWATAGVGRSRVRAVVGVDNPWKHVCSDIKADNNGFCNDPSNANGSPKVTPADPNDPNGPNGYDDLPRPILGCSTIDVTLHGSTVANCPPGATYAWDPATSTYKHTVTGAAPDPTARLVLMGDDPAVNAGAKYCYDDPTAGKYWGYFDCALQTPCDGNDAVAGTALGTGPTTVCGDVTGANADIRPACVRVGDGRVALFPTRFIPVTANGCLGGDVGGLPGGATATGLVFNWYGNVLAFRSAAAGDRASPVFNGKIGNCPVAEAGPTLNCVPAPGTEINGRNVYVLNRTNNGTTGRVEFTHTGGGETYLYGTIVIEGDGSVAAGCSGTMTDNDLALGNKSILTTAQRNMTMQTQTGRDSFVYGFPLTLVVFDPLQPFGAPPRPTGNPYSPQFLCADMGSANTSVNGMIYSGGSVQFNPIQVNGSVIAFEIQTQGGALSGIGYNTTYGLSTPPPGFPYGSGNQVVIIRKSFIVCASYNDDSGGGTACN